MTDADEPRLRRVANDGITVEKSIEENRFPVPAVQFMVRSDRDSETEVRITDEIPEDVPMDHIGFHPDFESEHWTAFSDHRVRFERLLDPGEEIETVYGIRDTESVDADAFLTEPEVESTDPEEAIMGMGGPDVEDLLADGIPEDADQLVRDLIGESDGEQTATADVSHETSGSAEASADPFESATADGEEDFLRDLDEEAAEPEPFATSPEPEQEPEATDDQLVESTTDPSQVDGEAIATALLKALKDDEIDDSVREELRAELRDGSDASPSTEVRLKHVQSRVEDLAAYTDALEAFIDEEGTSSVIERHGEDLNELEETVSKVAEQVDRERSARRDLADRVDSIEESVEEIGSVDEKLVDIRSAIDSLEDHIETNSSAVTSTEEDVAAIRSEVRALSEDVAELSTRTEETAELSEDLDKLQSTLEDVDDRVGELQSWRDHVTDVFGN